MSLATVKQLVEDKVRTLALGSDLASPLLRERAIGQAVLQLDADAPRQMFVDVAAVTGSQFAVPTGWVDGRSVLVAVECPIGTLPMSVLEAAVMRDATPAWQIVLAEDTLSGETVRVHFTAPHELTTAACTVPVQHENALACWAAAELCRQLATQKGHERDATISAVATSGASQSGDLSRRARDWLTQYRVALGLPDPEAAPGGQAAGVVVQLERTRRRGRFASLGA